jgi:hypothetical protein
MIFAESNTNRATVQTLRGKGKNEVKAMTRPPPNN